MDFITIIREELGEPTQKNAIEKYVLFVIEKSKNINSNYTEIHHLLPKSQFKQYKNNKNNLFELDYENHVKAHQLLCEAYPIGSFIRPLNFMLNQYQKSTDEYKKVISESRKNEWIKFKKTEKYKIWRKNRSEQMTRKMKDGLASELSNRRYTKNSNARNEISDHFKKLWNNDEYRNNIIQSMIKERNSPEGKARMKKAVTERWNNCSIEDREKFKEKMTATNQSEEKRLDASNKIKEKWQETEFQQKMKQRKTRGSDGSKMKELWANPEFREKMLKARQRKKHETN